MRGTLPGPFEHEDEHAVGARGLREEQRATTVPAEGLEDALQNLNWTRTDGTGHDWDWLASWIFTPRRAGRYIVLDGTEDSSAVVRREIARAPDMNAL